MLLEKAEHYASIVYNEDQIKDAKADRANLNRLKKALNDERLKREREYMESFNVFKGQINEIIGIIDKPTTVIDKQIKAFEEQQKAIKFSEIESHWHRLLQADRIPAGIIFNHLYDEKWLNASVKMSAIEKEFEEKLSKIESDLSVIEDLPYFAFEAKEAYYSHLDLGKAVSEAHRLQAQAEKKAAWEAEQARKPEPKSTTVNYGSSKPSEPIKETTESTYEAPKKSWIAYKALLSIDDANALRNFFEERNIQFDAI
jgi:hypothetical protein